MRNRVKRYVGRVRDELRKSFTQEYSTREVAGSFALGVFITMLPTLGAGLAVFVVLAYLFERINRIALFASVLVLNPVVKWGVYAASISLGFFLLGPVEGFDGGAITLDDGREVLIRLWIGNLILAVVAAAIAYPLAHRMVTGYKAREMDLFETTVEATIESFEDFRKDALPTDTNTTAETADTAPESGVVSQTEMDPNTETAPQTETDLDTATDDNSERSSTDHQSDN